jgi:Flp pilus assembly pilin Flp
MLRRPQFSSDESGRQLVEWAIVTVILILATFTILTLIGDELIGWFDMIREALQQVRD